MTTGRLKFAVIVLLGVVVSAAVSASKKKEKPPSAAFQMDEQKRTIHALNRLTFGPRPGDVAHVTAMGVDQWIDQQLHPDTINDNALEARLAPLRTLQMNTQQIVENFPPRQLIQAIAKGKESLPSDPTRRAIYLAELDRVEERRDRKQENANGSAAVDAGTPSAKMEIEPIDATQERNPDERINELIEVTPDERVRAVLKMSTDDRSDFMRSLKGKREQFFDGMSPEQHETVLALNNPQQVVVDELIESKILRAAYSERQLQEVMTDFWFNHFNVYIGKGEDHYLLTSYERDVIRRHAMGKFEDLLVATAQSPAMLFYLDNWLSVGPNSDAANGIPKGIRNWNRRPRNPPVKQAKGKRNGLNENYGRELMELHTLGVNAGYTQKDVTEVARVFTGWTLKRPREGNGFTFDERMHEPGDKMVLGHRIKYKGEKEGLEVLHILAHHPSTAKFICTKLATRFVSDNPPPQLVDRMAQTFLKKDGDIREVLKTMLGSPEFWSDDVYRAKVKTPLEFTVSALRASGAEISDAMPIARQLQTLGMPLYGAQPPTGYSTKAEAWVNSSALLGRMNFSLALTGGRVKGTQVDTDLLLENSQPTSAQQALAILEDSLLAGDVSKQTHDVVTARLEDSQVSQRKVDDPTRSPNVAMITGLLLGSPEFQRR